MRPRRTWIPASLLALALDALTLAGPRPAAALVTPNFVGSYGSGAVAQPSGVVIAPSGDAFVINEAARRVEKITRGGLHTFGFGGQGNGPGQFQLPFALALAPDGTLWVLDAASGRIQHFTTGGAYLGEFGATGSGNGQFSNPHGVAIDPAGNLYVADTSNDRLQKFSPAGVYLAQWGTPGSGDGQFNFPYGVGADTHGNVFVSDTYNHRIQEFTTDGAFVRTWGSQGAGDGQFVFPEGIAVDAGGSVFVCDVNNFRVQRFTPYGLFLAKWGTQGAGDGQFQAPRGIGIDRWGDVHVADYLNNNVQVFRSRDGTGHASILSWGGPGSNTGQFNDLHGVAVGPDGSIFVVDTQNDRVQKFTGYGAFVTTWGSFGSLAGQFNDPIGVAVDGGGTVYVTDNGNGRVQKFDSNGAYLGQWGAPGSLPGQFVSMWDIAVGPANDVYVVDANRVQEFTPGGFLEGWWNSQYAEGIGTDPEGSVYVACRFGNVVRKYTAAGSLLFEWGTAGANPGQFNGPVDVVCDTSGYVYVPDNNGRVQQFNQLGAYITEWGSFGSDPDQLIVPRMLAVDAWGSLYVSDSGVAQVKKLVSAPELISIADVAGDQGGLARVTFTPSSAEAPSSGAGAVTYRIVRFETNPPIGTVLASIPADGVTRSATVAMGANSTVNWTGVRELQVQALVSVPSSTTTGTNYGWSTDDLAPPAPSPFTGAYVSGATHLHWGVSPAADFSHFQLYRSASSAFPTPGTTYLWAGPDTGYVDAGPAGRWYRVLAADTSGNLGAGAVLGPDQTTDAPGDGVPGAALQLALDPLTPNPAHGAALQVRFTLPDAEPAQLELVDVAGRTVWTGAVRGEGAHVLRAGAGRRLAPGVYLVRLVSGGRSLVRRAVVLD